MNGESSGDTERAMFGLGMVAAAGPPSILFLINYPSLARSALGILGIVGVGLAYHYFIRSVGTDSKRSGGGR